MIDNNFFVGWYQANGRDFPWRHEHVSPFTLLVTEMLLRQTHTANVVKVWQSFTGHYPTPRSIVAAGYQELAAHLAILGLVNQRVDALKAMSSHLLEHHEGNVPDTLEELLAIPHVGIYAASAVMCFAFNQPEAIVDTNILRLYSRIFGLDIKPDARRNPHIWQLARDLLPQDPQTAKAHNYGLLDFTALLCTARRPKCEQCPLQARCVWYARNHPEEMEES